MRTLLLPILTVLLFISLNNTWTVSAQTVKNSNSIEVVYFHGKQRCVTCNAIEKLTSELLKTTFAKELQSGRIAMRVVDISNKDNEKIIDKYEVTWSSLILVKHEGIKEKRVNMTEIGFTYAKNKPDVFKEKLRIEINKLLK